MQLPTVVLATIVSAILCGCTVTRTVHLYPVDAPAADAAVLTGVIVGHGQGHGIAKINMPDGEVLSGEYSIVFGGSYGFGSIMGTVYGQRGSASVSGTSANFSIDGRGEGSASVVGERGTTAQCEFLNANMTGHGYGACRSSKGITYRMIY